MWRRGKYIVIELERGGAPAGCLVGHLRMSGRLHVDPSAVDAGPYARVCLDLDDGSVFHFTDVRKFGRLVFAERPEDVFSSLGPEPLGDDFTGEWLAGALR